MRDVESVVWPGTVQNLERPVAGSELGAGPKDQVWHLHIIGRWPRCGSVVAFPKFRHNRVRPATALIQGGGMGIGAEMDGVFGVAVRFAAEAESTRMADRQHGRECSELRLCREYPGSEGLRGLASTVVRMEDIRDFPSPVSTKRPRGGFFFCFGRLLSAGWIRDLTFPICRYWSEPCPFAYVPNTHSFAED